MLARKLLFNIFNVFIAAVFTVAWAGVQASVLGAMEKALMPGELSSPHAKLEDSCSDCHKLFGQEAQNRLCLDCHDHKNIAEDIQKRKGYHGRIPGIKNKECRVCHSEHKGRQHSIVLLDKQAFDHQLTDFPLRGRHRDAPCKACHLEDKKTNKQKPYHQASSQCIQCHKSDDAHKGQLGKQCESCHTQTRWLDFRFDHSATKFKLEGKHKGVDCRNCHPQQKYSDLPQKCVSCHQRDDKHNGHYGKKCQDCHTVSGWSNQHFNHDKDTEYPLQGKHKKVRCQQCHRSDGYTQYVEDGARKNIKKLKTDCYACHRLQDEHKGQFGRKCMSCHSVKGWEKQKFDHQKTDFPLKGKHKKLACGDCHSGEVSSAETSALRQKKMALDTTCISCHQLDDVHREQQGKKCQECHNETGWQNKVVFDHNLVKFPLLGAHSALACEECHSSGSFKDTKGQCLSCHREDDYHDQSLGTKCERCHYVGDWKAWEFDHDKQTEFTLTGKHEGIVCSACHQNPVTLHMGRATEGIKGKGNGKGVIEKFTMPSDCQDCHLQDDAHDGEFGRHCQRCHNTESFSDVQL
ncbi:MAG: hypothetical protein COB30_008635 [Ectothiorhodospiraceae bacterium]|nr:hypothetical protein [Ectothiorhodospiraceae bacterium]